MKSPVVLDFLDLPDSELLRESDLESAILSKLSPVPP
jgi:predicted nuclease of restriction endonuclease-like (RecB) superfamily